MLKIINIADRKINKFEARGKKRNQSAFAQVASRDGVTNSNINFKF